MTKMTDNSWDLSWQAEGAGKTDEIEEMLRRLIKVAKSEGRDFLAYLLTMALIEARRKTPPRQEPPATT